MHDLAFADAARPTPVRILGLKLLPYSIGHEIILTQKRNPLVVSTSGDEFVKLPEYERIHAIREAVIICSRTWEENKTAPKWLRLWCWTHRNADFDIETAQFIAYRTAGCAFPPAPDREAEQIAAGKTDSDPDHGREIGSPYFARLTGHLLKHNIPAQHGIDHVQDFPLALANFLYFSEMEVEGSMKVENSREAQVRLEMSEIRARVAKEQAVTPQN